MSKSLSRTVSVNVVRFNLRTEEKRKVLDEVAVEVPVNIFVGGEHFVTLLALPEFMEELGVGHLFSEGVVKSVSDVSDVRVEDNNVYLSIKEGAVRVKASRVLRLITTACGSSSDYLKLLDSMDKPLVVSDAEVLGKDVLKMRNLLTENTVVFKRTGGTHGAGVFTLDGELIACAEDVGRHNAVDKVVGICALKGVDFSRAVIFSTGRMSAEMVLKAARVGIPIVASLSAPLNSGVIFADRSGVTLICFVRGHRFNIYTHENRVIS